MEQEQREQLIKQLRSIDGCVTKTALAIIDHINVNSKTDLLLQAKTSSQVAVSKVRHLLRQLDPDSQWPDVIEGGEGVN